MSYLIFVCSLILMLFIVAVRKKVDAKNHSTQGLQKRLLRLLQFVKFAPVLAFVILLVLVLTYFHSKTGIRLSHAWVDAQFWTYTVLLYSFYRLSKNKWSLIFTIISVAIAVYNTPLFHYEQLFTGPNVVISHLMGSFMFLSMWLTVTMMTKRLNQES